MHECLTWLRQPGNNPHCFYGAELENFDKACKTLMQRLRHIIPEGSTRARIRATTRESRKLEEGSIGETLGDEARGMVVLDYDGHVFKYDQLEILSDFVAKEVNVLKVDVPNDSGRGWKRTNSEMNTQDVGENWCEDIAAGSKYVLEETWVKANDSHYDAKCWPCAHPYGTGSVNSEIGAGNPKGFVRNRANGIQSWFRRNALRAFWKLDWLIKKDLFSMNMRRKTKDDVPPASGALTKHFGTAIPKSIPESSAWWKAQQKELFALTDEAELGLMSAMVTITHNDGVSEMLANIRRGAFAQPDQSEKCEYLFTRVKASQKRPNFEDYALEHVLSYQRRVNAIKDEFMVRNKKTPLGIVRDWWDRTLANKNMTIFGRVFRTNAYCFDSED